MNRLGKKANETLIEMALSADGRRGPHLEAGVGADLGARTVRGPREAGIRLCVAAPPPLLRRGGWAETLGRDAMMRVSAAPCRRGAGVG